MLAVDCAVAWETSRSGFSALLALDESVLSWVCAVPMAVDAPASPLPALAAASCTSFRALRAAFVCCGTLANWVSRSAIAERIVPTFRLVLSSSPMVSLAMVLVLPLMVPLAELTALTSTSLTVGDEGVVDGAVDHGRALVGDFRRNRTRLLVHVIFERGAMLAVGDDVGQIFAEVGRDDDSA